jgi:hypothetical protein
VRVVVVVVVVVGVVWRLAVKETTSTETTAQQH